MPDEDTKPLGIGDVMGAGASWGNEVPEDMRVDNGKGTAGSKIGLNGLPIGVPSSSESGLAAPQSAEVAAAAAAKVSLDPPVRVTVATVKAASGVRFKFDSPAEEFDEDSIKATLARILDVNTSKITLSAAAKQPTSRRRLQTGTQFNVFLETGNPEMLETVEGLSSLALSSQLGIPVDGLSEPHYNQVQSVAPLRGQLLHGHSQRAACTALMTDASVMPWRLCPFACALRTRVPMLLRWRR